MGDYGTFFEMVLTFSAVKDTLFLQVKGDDNKVKLIRTSDYTFTYPNIPHSTFEFVPTQDSMGYTVKWHISDFTYSGQRMQWKEFDK